MKHEQKPHTKGLVHFYYGKGCGKTSNVLGHILRALGHGKVPVVIQFLKKHDPTCQQGFFFGEYPVLTQALNVPVYQFGEFFFIKTASQIAKVKEIAAASLTQVKTFLQFPEIDLLILDEIGSMVELGLITAEELADLIQNRNPSIEVLMTGHQKIEPLAAIADYITHFEEIKHPFQQGVQARVGIDF